MTRLLAIWRTTTVRLTALFILIFAVFSVGLLGFIAYESSIAIQRQQTEAIGREIEMLQRLDRFEGMFAVAVAVQRLASRPGPGLYFLADPVGQMIAGNVAGFPSYVLEDNGVYSFAYTRGQPADGPAADDADSGHALVRTQLLDSGLRLVVGRDIVERREFTAIIFGGFGFGALGILLLSVVAGGLTAMRVLKRIDAITGTSAEIMSGNLSERVPVTARNDEFDRLATSLNAMLDRIEQLMVGLKQVSDNVAHDLKTPLTRMRNRAEAALRDPDPAVRDIALERTIGDSDQLIRTFNALLMIARAEAGTPGGAFAPVDAGRVAAEIGELYAPVAEDAGLALSVEAAEGLTVSASRELLGQALVNLVENAVKYGQPEAGGGTLVLSAGRTAEGRVRIAVADGGPGIPEPDRARVVERFVRLEESRTEPGSGLGLSLVAAVARLHGGELRVEDNAPGTRAVIELPAG